MMVRVKKTGEIFDNANWFGFNHWIRAWAGTGWLHWHASELEVINQKERDRD